MKENLQKSVISTIVFFDIFNRPLSAEEIWRFCQVKCNFAEIVKTLDDITRPINGHKLIDSKAGLFFLSGRADIVQDLNKQTVLNDQKTLIGIRAAKKLRFINGVEMVAICNNFNYKKNSDIDLLIVVSKNRIWLTRFMVTLIIQFFGLRRHGNKITDRICLSFYISEEALNLENITLKNDIYFYHWLALMLPVYDNEMFCKFWQQNKWLMNYLPNIKANDISATMIKNNFYSIFLKRLNHFWFSSRVGDFLERVMKKIQIGKMQKNIWSVAAANDSRVIISDAMLKFHEKDRREYYKEKYQEKMQTYEHVGNQ